MAVVTGPGRYVATFWSSRQAGAQGPPWDAWSSNVRLGGGAVGCAMALPYCLQHGSGAGGLIMPLVGWAQAVDTAHSSDYGHLCEPHCLQHPHPSPGVQALTQGSGHRAMLAVVLVTGSTSSGCLDGGTGLGSTHMPYPDFLRGLSPHSLGASWYLSHTLDSPRAES